MANLNKVMLIGNLTRDIELRYIPSQGAQTAVCDLGLATNRTWTGADGIKKEEVTFVDCTVFGKQAETLAKYKKKGDPLFIEGRLKLDTWEKDGQKHYKMKVVVENFQFLNRGQPGAYGGGQSGQSGQGGSAGGDAEYTGEDSAPAPRQVAAPQSRQQPFRPQGRPGAQPVRPAAAPNYDVGDVPSVPEDEGVNIKGEDIPF